MIERGLLKWVWSTVVRVLFTQTQPGDLESCEEDKKLRRLGEVPAKMELADA